MNILDTEIPFDWNLQPFIAEVRALTDDIVCAPANNLTDAEFATVLETLQLNPDDDRDRRIGHIIVALRNKQHELLSNVLANETSTTVTLENARAFGFISTEEQEPTTNLEQSMNGQLETVNAQLEGVMEQLATVIERLEAMEGRLDAMEGRLDEMNQ